MDGLSVDESRILGRQHAEIEELRERVADLEEKLRRAKADCNIAYEWIDMDTGNWIRFVNWCVEMEQPQPEAKSGN